MNDYTGEMLAEMWTALKPYIDKKERLDAAVAFLRAAENFTDLENYRSDLTGIDAGLDGAIDEILGEDENIYDSEQDEY